MVKVLEAYIQRSGFRPGEQHTVHSRKRFRLVPGPAPVPNAPQVDPNLWIVHYGPADKQDRIHVQMVSVSPQMQQMINYRQQLFQMGQIVKKEFMLSDRVNWPQLPLPGRGQSMYAPPMPPRHIPPTMAYPRTRVRWLAHPSAGVDMDRHRELIRTRWQEASCTTWKALSMTRRMCLVATFSTTLPHAR